MNPIRRINFNGYIDDEVWFGDEVTPEILQRQLYGEDGSLSDDIEILMNSYGGSCNAAIRMHDMIRAYPGHVLLTVSGTAASAATVISTAADTVTMTTGSLFMIHDPIMLTYGNEAQIMTDIELLRACKASILNVYALRCHLPRDEIATMMTQTTWMDAQVALEHGFIDRIHNNETKSGAVANAIRAPIINKRDAERRVAAFYERKWPRPAQKQTPEANGSGVSHALLSQRLQLLKYQEGNG